MSQQFSPSPSLSALEKRLEALVHKAASIAKKFSKEKKNREKNASPHEFPNREHIKKNLLLERINQCLGAMEHDLVTILQRSSPDSRDQSRDIPHVNKEPQNSDTADSQH